MVTIIPIDRGRTGPLLIQPLILLFPLNGWHILVRRLVLWYGWFIVIVCIRTCHGIIIVLKIILSIVVVITHQRWLRLRSTLFPLLIRILILIWLNLLILARSDIALRFLRTCIVIFGCLLHYIPVLLVVIIHIWWLSFLWIVQHFPLFNRAFVQPWRLWLGCWIFGISIIVIYQLLLSTFPNWIAPLIRLFQLLWALLALQLILMAMAT